MEDWEREHIRKNLTQLTEETKCRQTLLDKLRASGVIGSGDVDEMKRDGLTDYERASKLYELVQTKVKGFQELSTALLADSQTGAYRILQKGFVSHKGTLSDELASIVLFTSIHPEIEELLDDDTINILIISTPDVQLSLKRISDVGPDYLIMHDEKTSRFSKRKLESANEEMALVVHCRKLEDTLKRYKGSGSQANVVLLTEESRDDIEKIVQNQKQAIKVVKEDISWTDLTPQAQKIILQQCIKFQNQVIPLNQIPPEIFPTEEVRGHFMFELLNGTCPPELVKNSVPRSPSYYVPRKISSRVKLSPEVFRNAQNDVFVVEGVELYQLTNLARNKKGEVVPVARSSQQLQKLTTQFIQLDHGKDYQDICELSKNPVHLISHRTGKYFWRRSHNSLGIIQHYICESKESDPGVENEDNFVKTCLSSENPICIADSPGMGKTLLLARIAEKVLMSESGVSQLTVVVRFLVLRDLMPEVRHQSEMSGDYACELIAKSSSDYDLGKKIVVRALKEEKIRCHVFLDGYDELLSSQVGTVNELLGHLRKLKNTQVYVTTRLNRCHELEAALVTLGYYIKPFDEEDQGTFLAGYWSEKGAEKNERVKEFAKSCLSRLKSGMTETERDIAGIPLQCRLLAEVHAKSAKRFSEGRDVVLDGASRSSSSLFGMFQAFMRQSFKKVGANIKNGVRRAHIYCAIKLLFPEIEERFKLAFLEDGNWEQDDSILLAPGILEIAGNSINNDRLPTFIHRTLAEYIIADFAYEYLETAAAGNSEQATIFSGVLRDVLSTSMVNDILFRSINPRGFSIKSQEFQYPVICYFLNSLLGAGSNNGIDQQEETELNCQMHDTSSSPERSLLLQPRNASFTAAVASNFPAIASFLSNLSNFDAAANLPWSNLFLFAAKYGGTSFTGQLKTLAERKRVQISEVKTYPEVQLATGETFVLTPLHVAVHWGNFNVAMLLLNNSDDNSQYYVLPEESQARKYLLHACVTWSSLDTAQVLSDKIQIIKWLCSEEGSGDQQPTTNYRHMLEERLKDGTTPLLQMRVHAKLIQTLIQVGADINATNSKNECVLHRVIYGFNPIQYHELLETLEEETTTFQHYNLEATSLRISPFRSAIERLDVEMRTVELFLKKGADINHVCERFRRDSVLMDVLTRGRSKDFVREFAVRGANLVCDMNGRTSRIPAEVMQAVEYAIETSPSLLNTYNCKIVGSSAAPAEDNLPCIINAKVNLQEMESHQLSSYVLSLHNNRSKPNNNDTPLEPSFVVHCLTSKVIERKYIQAEDGDSWGLAFNYNKIQQNNNVVADVRACTAKVVLLDQELIGEIEKVFQQTGKYPIVAVEAVQLKDLPETAQQLICNQKASVPGEYESDDTLPLYTQRRNTLFPMHLAKGKFLFDCTIQHHTSLLNRDLLNSKLRVRGEASIISQHKIITSRRNISTSIFETPGNDVFVVDGLGLHKLAEFTQGSSTANSSNQTAELTARFIRLESEDDFGKICSLSNFPVHLLSYHDDDGNFSWRKSHGSLAYIQNHVHEHQQQFTLATFLKDFASRDTPTCLVIDEWVAGGIMYEVVAELRKQNSTSIIPFCLDLDYEFIEKVKASLTPATAAAQFIAEMLSDYTLGRECVIHWLHSEERPCHLIFECFKKDPFEDDELLALSNLVASMKQLENLQLHFIVRKEMLLDMEKALQTLSFNFVLA